MIVVWIVLWLALSLVNAGFVLAYFQNMASDFGRRFEKCRKIPFVESFVESRFKRDATFSVLISLIPFSLFVTPFLTSFYKHGWMWIFPKKQDVLK